MIAPQLVAVHDAIATGDVERGRQLWQRLYPVLAIMFSDDFVSAVKTGLELRGVAPSTPRHPLPVLPEDVRARLAQALEELDAADA